MVQTSLTTRKFLLILPLLLLASLWLVACNDTGNIDAADATEFAPETYPNSDLLISADELSERLGDRDLRVVDLSPIGSYQQGHIPDAVHIWWQDTIEIHNDIYGMLTNQETREELFRDAGITPERFVVVYDDSGGHHAARFLWMLHVVGFDENVALLNGGRQAWEAAGYELTTDAPDIPTGDIPQEMNYDVLIGGDDVLAAIDDPDALIVDGRTEQERQETWFDRLRTGQIPTSIHLPRDETLQDGDVPYFKSSDELMKMLPDTVDPATNQTVITYGLHGVAASHTWFTMRLLGFEPVRSYDASWAEWSANPDRPVEQ